MGVCQFGSMCYQTSLAMRVVMNFLKTSMTSYYIPSLLHIIAPRFVMSAWCNCSGSGTSDRARLLGGRFRFRGWLFIARGALGDGSGAREKGEWGC